MWDVEEDFGKEHGRIGLEGEGEGREEEGREGEGARLWRGQVCSTESES